MVPEELTASKTTDIPSSVKQLLETFSICNEVLWPRDILTVFASELIAVYNYTVT